MIDLDRFQSGVSVPQARKDAKKLAKKENIPLHKALDVVALKNSGLSWNKAIKDINTIPIDGYGEDLLASFALKTQSGNAIIFSLSKRNPVAYIVGMSGSGKSVSSLLLAEQHLCAGKNVVYLPGHDMPMTSPITQDMAHKKAIDLVSQFPDRFRISNGDAPTNISSLNFKPKTLVIIDELWMFSRKGDVGIAITALCERGAGVIITGQSRSDFPESLPIFDSEIVSFLLLGKMKTGISNDSEMREVIKHTSSQVGVFNNSESRFLLALKDTAAIVAFTR